MSADKDTAPAQSSEEQNRDLGFGSILSQQKQRRLLNRDGSFNVSRKTNLWNAFGSYHALLTMSWPRFVALVICGYLLANILFATIYVLCGPGTLQSSGDTGLHSRFFQAFFFSVHTFSTIGYGNTVPVGLLANLIVTLESLTSLLGFALATGLVFARFSRPVAKILFSDVAIITPYKGVTAFQFRITNIGVNQLIGLSVRVVFSRMEESAGSAVRRYYPLEIERDQVLFLPLAWTIVHVINQNSPLYQVTREELIASEAEILVLLAGTDETFSQTVQTRSSYRADEIVWNAKFVNTYAGSGAALAVDLERFHQVEKVAIPAI